MKLKGKLVTLLSAFCLVFAMLMVGVWALKTVDFKVDGNINFYTKGINATISKGVVSGGTYKNAEDEPNKMKEIKINTDKTMTELNQEFLSWRGVYLNFNSSGEDLTITFSITNDSETEGDLVKAVVYFDGATGDNATVSISSYNALLGPGESQEFVITFHIVDPTLDASVPSFDFSFDITDGSVGQDVVSYLTFEYDDATRTAKVIDCADWVADAEIPEIVNNGIRSYTVTSIGGGSEATGAFAGCNNLKSIVIPQTVSQIGSYAFYNCSSLERVDATSLSSWQAIDFGNEYSNPMYASTKESFYVNNEKTTSLNLSSINIDSYTYAGFDDLTELALADTVAVIETDAFKDCGNIETLVVGKGLSSGITASMFGGCASLKNLTTSSNIANNGFKNITSLQDVKLKNGVISVGESGFSGCNALTQIEIAESVAKFNTNAFDGCSLLKSANYLGDLNSWMSITYGGSKSTPLCATGSLYLNGVLLENLVIDTATKIGAYAFYHITSIKSLQIGSQARSIGAQAFNGCTGIDGEIVIPEGIKQIPSYAFASCSAVDSISLPSTLTEILQSAFINCSGLTEVTIPANVASIGKLAFSNCTNLQTIICMPTAVPTMVEVSALQSCTNLTAIYVPNESVDAYKEAESWSAYADIIVGFVDAESCGLTFSYSGDEATITGRSGAIDSNFVIPEKVLYSGKVYTVTCIGKSAFASNSGLESITIPATVTRIGWSAFYQCTSLESMNYLGTLEAWCQINFNEFSPGYMVVGTLGTPTIYTKKLTIQGVDVVGDVVISEGVSAIGAGAFYNCNGITSITIPSSVTSIGESAFSGCYGLKTMICLATSAPSFGTGGLSAPSLTTIYVPSESVDAYKSANGWSGFANKIVGFEDADAEGYYLTFEYNDEAESASVMSEGTELTASVLGNTISESMDLIIPERVLHNGKIYEVTSIGENAFKDCSALTGVEIPSSVTSIGEDAFYNCSALSSMNYLGTIKEWVSISFGNGSANPTYYTKSLVINGTAVTSITASDLSGVASIGANAFNRCENIASVEIPSGVTNIGVYAFSGCSNLTTVVCLATSVPSLGSNVFANCTNLTAIYVPAESVTAYKGATNWSTYKDIIFGFTDADAEGYYLTFEYSDEVESASVMSSGETLTASVIDCSTDSSVVTSAIIPEVVLHDGKYYKVVEIAGGEYTGGSAFNACANLTSITIPNTITTIGKYAFSGCSKLTSINIPASVTSISSSLGYNCKELAEISVDANNTIYDSRNDCDAIIESSSHKLILGCKNTIIPETVTVINSSAFDGCSGLTSIAIPENVNSIGAWAFSGCRNLESISLPSSIDKIKQGTFNYCLKLKEVNISEGLTAIESIAFKGAQSLEKITLPSTVNTIASSAFENCTVLTTVVCLATNVLSLGSNVFANCSNLTGIYVPNESLTAYKEATNWSTYKDIIFGFTDADAEGYYLTFGGYDDEAMTAKVTGNSISEEMNVTIPEYILHQDELYTITEIQMSAFRECTNLIGVTIPSSVTTMENAFIDCTKLAKVNYLGTIKQWASIDFTSAAIRRDSSPTYYSKSLYIKGEKLTTIKAEDLEGLKNILYSVFSNCKDLVSVVLPSGLNKIYPFAFYGCSSLTSITIPDSVITIGDYAFQNCTGLESITIGSGIKSIGKDSFNGCTKLKSMNYLGTIKSWVGISFGNEYSNPTYYTNSLVINGTTVKAITETDLNGVKSIRAYAFYKCYNLTSITIPSSVTSIGANAFYDCAIASVTIPASVTSIGDYAFYSSHAQVSIVIDSETVAKGLTSDSSMGYLAFDFGIAVKEIYIQEGLTITSYISTNYAESSSDKEGYVLYIPLWL